MLADGSRSGREEKEVLDKSACNSREHGRNANISP